MKIKSNYFEEIQEQIKDDRKKCVVILNKIQVSLVNANEIKIKNLKLYEIDLLIKYVCIDFEKDKSDGMAIYKMDYTKYSSSIKIKIPEKISELSVICFYIFMNKEFTTVLKRNFYKKQKTE